jgi:hypothetical protein
MRAIVTFTFVQLHPYSCNLPPSEHIRAGILFSGGTMKTTKATIAALAVMLFSALAMFAQEAKPVAAAPVPSQITSAKKVFVSNAGVDAIVLNTFRRLGDPDRPYNQFYAAMKEWGRYELVSSPADADLVYEIRFTAPITDTGKITSFAPQYGVTIVDAKTHFTLWTLGEPVEGAFRKATFERNLNTAMNGLMENVRKLAAPTEVLAGVAQK